MLRVFSLFILPVLVLPGLALVAAEYWHTDRVLQEKLSARATDLEQRFNQSSILPSLLASDPRIKILLSDQSDEKVVGVSELLELTVNNSEVAVAFLMDSTGLTIASSNYAQPVSFIGKNYGFRPYFFNSMKGERSTFFAVGATTGIPGYFISEPVKDNEAVVGVVVVKLEPKQLPLSWTEDDSVTVVTDELGVIILSTESDFLYKASRSLNEAELEQIATERRYEVSESNKMHAISIRHWEYLNASDSSRFRVFSGSLDIEPWMLTVLTPMQGIFNRMFRNIIFMLGALSLVGLSFHAYRQQRLLAIERDRTAKRLEHIVEERTRELKEAQSALITESNFSMLGKMSAAINHEINQPLASMRFDLATLRQILEKNSGPARATGNYAEDYDAESIVVDLDRTAKRIARVIETLRVLPKQQKANFLPVDMNSVMQQSIETIRDDRRQLSKYLYVEPLRNTEERYYVSGQSVLLQQAILNLLYNALDALVDVANNEIPYADIQLRMVGKGLEITVRDNGPGIDPLVEPVLFEPFESTSIGSEGLGLGLTLARQIITWHGGTITCSRISYEGTTQMFTVFTIALPLLDSFK